MIDWLNQLTLNDIGKYVSVSVGILSIFLTIVGLFCLGSKLFNKNSQKQEDKNVEGAVQQLNGGRDTVTNGSNKVAGGSGKDCLSDKEANHQGKDDKKA